MDAPQREGASSAGASAPGALRRRHLEVGSNDWLYWSAGHRGRGLLLLGAALADDQWSRRLIGLLESNHRVLAPRYPKHTAVSGLADGLIALMNADGHEEVDVFGNELGAAVAHDLARRYPGRVGRMALAGWGVPTWRHRLNQAVCLWALKFLPYDSLRLRWRRRQREQLAAPDHVLEAEAMRQIELTLDRHDRASALAELKLVLGQGGGRASTTVDAERVLLMFANDDRRFDRHEQDALGALYPQARVVRFLWDGCPLGMAPAWGFEHKLELFFRGLGPAPS